MGANFGLKFKVAKLHFFDGPITDGLSKKAKTVLSRFGAYVRRDAKKSIRKARMKTKAEMTRDERIAYEIRVRKWKDNLGARGPRPKRPLKPSRPGEPPRSRDRKSLLKLIFFTYDPGDKSVSVGPIGIRASGLTPGEATEALEYGGRSTNYQGDSVRITERPFMRPSFHKNFPHLQEWRNSL